MVVKYTSTKQLTFAEFKTPFETALNKKNRWVVLANHLPWDDLAAVYIKSLRCDFGRPSVDARVVIGAMIIKHKKSMTDEETIEEIRENPYMQYFLGLQGFTDEPVFDPSLFVTLRKRMGLALFDEMQQKILDQIGKQNHKKEQEKSASSSKQKPETEEKQTSEKQTGSDDIANRGTLIVDATVAPQDIKFPTDLDLLNSCREKAEEIIDELYQTEPGKRKPRTYRKVARKAYLATIRKKNKPANQLRKAIRKQLNFVKRNISTINSLLNNGTKQISSKSLQRFWILQEIHRQQQDMYNCRSNRINDRIVSLSQPHVRPIVRGKAGKKVEFGAKLSVSLVNGFAYLDNLSWDAFNEGNDLPGQIEKYKERFGVYPEVVLADHIYGSRSNRNILKEKGIRFSGKPLGRPPKLSKEEKKSIAAEAKKRTLIEGVFGVGKRKYDLGLVKAKTRNTSESWIAIVLFVMNLEHWLRISFCAYFLNPIINLIYCWIDNFRFSYNFKGLKLAI